MPLTIDFTGKLVLLTGGGRGIGLAIATALAKAGADIAITYTSKDATAVAEQLSKKYNTRVKVYKCEVSKSSEVDSVVEAVQKDFGKQIDIGIANAGTALWKEAEGNTDEEFKRVFEGLPVSIKEGEPANPPAPPTKLNKQLLFVSSISGLVAMTPQKQASYNSSKAALTMLAKSLAAEWAPYGVAVNSISPGYVMTSLNSDPPGQEGKAWLKEWEYRTPMGRFGTTEEIGEAVALMLSDKMGGTGWMTGSDVVIDGGYTLV